MVRALKTEEHLGGQMARGRLWASGRVIDVTDGLESGDRLLRGGRRLVEWLSQTRTIISTVAGRHGHPANFLANEQTGPMSPPGTARVFHSRPVLVPHAEDTEAQRTRRIAPG